MVDRTVIPSTIDREATRGMSLVRGSRESFFITSLAMADKGIDGHSMS